MPEKEVKKLKQGETILLEGSKYKIEKIEFSAIGKHGKSKCRIEASNDKGEKKVVIKVADDTIETP
jgi:translation elongation factor P/translation initiation factor 5A